MRTYDKERQKYRYIIDNRLQTDIYNNKARTIDRTNGRLLKRQADRQTGRQNSIQIHAHEFKGKQFLNSEFHSFSKVKEAEEHFIEHHRLYWGNEDAYKGTRMYCTVLFCFFHGKSNLPSSVPLLSLLHFQASRGAAAWETMTSVFLRDKAAL